MKPAQQAITNLLTLTLCLMLPACSPLLSRGMSADTMRAGIDACKQRDLNVLLYKRPDSSVFAIRCTPRDDEISRSVIVRPKMPMNALRSFIRKEVMVVEE